MKIGILTFHRAYNYGAVLQCYALQEYLIHLGYDVWIIDYRQPWIEKFYHRNFFSLLRHPRGYLHYLRRKHSFVHFVSDFLYTTSPCYDSMPQNFDAYIIGSDQVWGSHCLGGTFDDFYMGKFKHDQSLLIGYAISTNKKSLYQLGKDEISASVERFDALSFREEKNISNVKKIAGVNIKHVLDPTLILNAKLWDNIINDKWKKKNYVFLYQLRRPSNNPLALNEEAELLAKKYNGKVIDFSSMLYTPSDFVSAIKYANCIVTSSFHATVFSLLFEKPFLCYLLEDGHDDRYENLLKDVGGTDALVSQKYYSEKVPMLDYRKIQENINKLRIPSVEFLTNSLRQDEDKCNSTSL